MNFTVRIHFEARLLLQQTADVGVRARGKLFFADARLLARHVHLHQRSLVLDINRSDLDRLVLQRCIDRGRQIAIDLDAVKRLIAVPLSMDADGIRPRLNTENVIIPVHVGCRALLRLQDLHGHTKDAVAIGVHDPARNLPGTRQRHQRHRHYQKQNNVS